ncbi:hypothetical protein V1520DRAFT_155358 [Lipomyces starkeyi]|uniref:Uncharacterized protein n=1 Tax=Lipomyces starkeyi NRRL Y-11557 TaxID=675824 RepID=A0A1E3Q689_LIPST|nr:hypothetical protein LIPSTDRAFT_71479 [Lipomyces starkeyi NRRL Y-11557]
MPARSKRSKANQEPELNKHLGNHDFAEDETQAEYDGTESERQPPNAKLVYFAEADKSLKRTIYTGGSERTQRRWRAQLKSNDGMRSLFDLFVFQRGHGLN